MITIKLITPRLHTTLDVWVVPRKGELVIRQGLKLLVSEVHHNLDDNTILVFARSMPTKYRTYTDKKNGKERETHEWIDPLK